MKGTAVGESVAVWPDGFDGWKAQPDAIIRAQISLPMAGDVPNPGEELFNAHLADIKRIVRSVCAAHYFASADVEDFEQEVYKKLIEDDYRRLRRWKQKSRLSTFLYAVIDRLLVDFIRRDGRWRPSREAVRKGEIAILLETYMQRDGYRFEEACELLWTNHGVTLSREELRKLAERHPIRFPRHFESDEGLANLPTNAPAPDDQVIKCQRDRYFAALRAALREIVKPMPPRDQYVLLLRFWEDRKSVV